jgi:hypothetical protein
MSRPRKGYDINANSIGAKREAIKAAYAAQVQNDGKIPIRIDARTVIYVRPEERELHERKIRLQNARKTENREKVQWLEKTGWTMGLDGIWRNPSRFLVRDFETALHLSGYFDRNRTPYR